MKNIFILLFSFFVFSWFSTSFAEVVVGDPHQTSTTKSRRSLRFETDNEPEGSFYSYREKHRFGLNVGWAGLNGLVGGGLELNLSGSDSAIIGVGTGDGFSTLDGGWKHFLSNNTLSPYFAVGYSRWSHQGKTEIDRTSPNFVYDRLLTGDEKLRGQFVKDIIFSSLGLQYTNLSGSYKGVGGYVEVNFLTSLRPLDLVTVVGAGGLFYF